MLFAFLIFLIIYEKKLTFLKTCFFYRDDFANGHFDAFFKHLRVVDAARVVYAQVDRVHGLDRRVVLVGGHVRHEHAATDRDLNLLYDAMTSGQYFFNTQEHLFRVREHLASIFFFFISVILVSRLIKLPPHKKR